MLQQPAGARLIYADGLEERGRDEAAGGRREQAARCEAFDPDFDEAVLADLHLPEDWEVAVFPIGTSELVWVHGQKDAAFCETPELHTRLLELADKGPLPDPDTFWEDIPAPPRYGRIRP